MSRTSGRNGSCVGCLIGALLVLAVLYSMGWQTLAAVIGGGGALLALVIFLQQRRERAEWQARRDALLTRFGDESIVQRILTKQIWSDETEEQLLESLGRPQSTETTHSRDRTREVWTFGSKGVGGLRLRVTMENGKVVEWKEWT